MGNTDKFEAMAGKYDTPERIEVAKVAADAIRQWLPDVPGGSAMDFGCGTGLVGLQLLDAFNSVFFVDSSEKMVDQVKEKIVRSGMSGVDGMDTVETLCSDLEVVEALDVQVDHIFMVQVLLHIKDHVSLLKKLRKSLKPEGTLTIIDFDYNEFVESDLVHSGFRQDELKAELEAIGFESVRSKTFYSGEGLFMNQYASMFIMEARWGDFESAIAFVMSSLDKCRKIQPKFKAGTSQNTLLQNRIKALEMAEMVLHDPDSVVGIAEQDIEEALVPLRSIRHKCKQAMDKHEEGTRHHMQFSMMVQAMDLSIGLIEKKLR